MTELTNLTEKIKLERKVNMSMPVIYDDDPNNYDCFVVRSVLRFIGVGITVTVFIYSLAFLWPEYMLGLPIEILMSMFSTPIFFQIIAIIALIFSYKRPYVLFITLMHKAERKK